LPGIEKSEIKAETPIVSVEPAPQSWKPAEKAKWATLDPEVRTEVLRREREISKALNETAPARQFQTEFQQAVQPYLGRIQSIGVPPLQAIQGLLQADYVLSTAPKPQKAAYLAKLIKDYDVDIEALDQALSGQQVADPLAAKVEALVQQRLAPFQQIVETQQRTAAQQAQQAEQQLAAAISAISTDKVKYPYFEQVRDSMADVIELSIRKGKQCSLEEAYNKACQLDQTISTELATKSAAAKANEAAQRARKASVQVGGSPTGSISGSPAANDRRATIAAAFESVGAR
jgi:hypothetical protein